MTAVKRVGDIPRMQHPCAPAEAVLKAERASQDGPAAGGKLKRARGVCVSNVPDSKGHDGELKRARETRFRRRATGAKASACRACP